MPRLHVPQWAPLAAKLTCALFVSLLTGGQGWALRGDAAFGLKQESYELQFSDQQPGQQTYGAPEQSDQQQQPAPGQQTYGAPQDQEPAEAPEGWTPPGGYQPAQADYATTLPPTDNFRLGLCVKDTGRECKSAQSASIVEHTTQCLAGEGPTLFDWNPTDNHESDAKPTCSADAHNTPRGTCQCGPGFCADTDMLCHKGTYKLVADVFTITTKANPQERIFMTADGKVRQGIPEDPRQAHWRISVTWSGHKILFTEMYRKTILQEYQSCANFVDSFGLKYSNCKDVVGHIENPQADDMGWFMELYKMAGAIPIPGEDYVTLRAAGTYNMFYIDPTTKEGMSCEAQGRNCPGDAGAFKINPDPTSHPDLNIDYAPGQLPPGLGAYFVTVSTAVLLLCCVCCVYAADPQKNPCMACIAQSCLVFPKECARSCGIMPTGPKM